MAATEKALRLIPGLEVQTIESSCCGMAGAFGYQAETYEISLAMGELSLLPRVREAAAATLIIADGFSCRHQIRDGTKRAAIHVAEALDRALAAARRTSPLRHGEQSEAIQTRVSNPGLVWPASPCSERRAVSSGGTQCRFRSCI